MASKYGSQRNKQQLTHYDFETNIKKKTGKMGVRRMKQRLSYWINNRFSSLAKLTFRSQGPKSMNAMKKLFL